MILVYYSTRHVSLVALLQTMQNVLNNINPQVKTSIDWLHKRNCDPDISHKGFGDTGWVVLPVVCVVVWWWGGWCVRWQFVMAIIVSYALAGWRRGWRWCRVWRCGCGCGVGTRSGSGSRFAVLCVRRFESAFNYVVPFLLVHYVFELVFQRVRSILEDIFFSYLGTKYIRVVRVGWVQLL